MVEIEACRHPHTAMLAVVIVAMFCRFEGYDAFTPMDPNVADRILACVRRDTHPACALSIIRNAIINYFRACGVERIAAMARANVLKPDQLLTKLGIFNL